MTQTPAERRKPRAEFRQEALQRATEIAKAHTALSYPADFTVHAAVRFADFLENGSEPKPEEQEK